jgi:GTP-binding protein EngB required for normal cell division
MSSPAAPPAAYQSPFQLFIKGIQDLYPDKSIKSVLEKYPVPQLVMIGSESTGKSSVLENITKTEIFPTNQKTCTRCPIKVVMIPADNGDANTITVEFRGTSTVVGDALALKSKMEELFEAIRTTSLSGYCDDVVTVTLVHPNVVRIDLVDLPGIVSYPPQARDFTTNMCLRYIRDPNSFLICVANATIPRLNSYEPIARILECNAQDRTIIVLTMADKLRPEDYSAQLTNRLKMTTDELNGGKFLACCAVVNRGSQEVPLPHQPDAEQRWFQERLLISLSEREKASLTPHLGIAQLQLQVNELYEKYLREKWLPRIIADIQATVQGLQKQIADIGKVVDDTNFAQFRDDLVASDCLGAMFRSILLLDSNRTTGNSFYGKSLTMQEVLDQTYSKRVTEAMKSAVNMYDVNSLLTIQQAPGGVFGTSTVAAPAGFGFGAKPSATFASDWKPQRYTGLWKKAKELLCEVIDKYITKAFSLLQPVLLQQLLAPPPQPVDYANQVVRQASTIFLDACKERLLKSKEIVREDPAVAKKRAGLHASVSKYEVVKDALQASARGKPASPVKGAGNTV